MCEGWVKSKEGDPKQHCVRKGKIGSWREEMTAEQVQIIEDKYGRTMQAVGYQSFVKQPIVRANFAIPSTVAA